MKKIKLFLGMLITIMLVNTTFCKAAEVTKINQPKGQVFINEGKDAGFIFGAKVCFPSSSNEGMIYGKILRTTDSYSIVKIKDRRETKKIKVGSEVILYIKKENKVITNKNTVKDLLQNRIEAAIDILKNDIDQQEKDEQIIEIITPLFNFSLMSKLSLGKRYWPDLSKEDKHKFTELFTKRLKESCLNKLNLYTDEKVIFKTPIQVKRKMKIPTELISKGDTVTILYKFYKSKDGWFIYDVEVQGVSIISTYRSQFDQVLREGTINDLLSKLEEPEQQGG